MDNAPILITAASVAFIHTVFGPDHYVPFVALSKARNWTRARTAAVTFFCGVGHVGSSVLIGLAGILLGASVSRLAWFEGLRGDTAGWLLVSFGLAYMLWGIKKAIRGEKHSHSHAHAETARHSHEHSHETEHAHVHGNPASVTPWALFIIFILGPCEPLIPLLMYPGMKGGLGQAMATAAVFSAVTLFTMLASVFMLLRGVRLFPVERMERYAHALAGFAILSCGIAVKAGL
jgi:ABC-type nickel/cobalt efflux system permease component RcnA